MTSYLEGPEHTTYVGPKPAYYAAIPLTFDLF